MKWESKFKQELTTNPVMNPFVESLKFYTRLEPRQAFFGGHTNAVCPHKEVNNNVKIHYVNFTSLYSWTNKYCEIPNKHPDILTSEAVHPVNVTTCLKWSWSRIQNVTFDSSYVSQSKWKTFSLSMMSA